MVKDVRDSPWAVLKMFAILRKKAQCICLCGQDRLNTYIELWGAINRDRLPRAL